jgi:four helix bundle protein
LRVEGAIEWLRCSLCLLLSSAMSDDIIRNHRDLIVWQTAMQVRREVRKILLAIPRQDRFEIGGQVTRAAWSIPCNIAEGQMRLDRRDYKQFLSYSRGSVGELDTQLLALAEDHPHFETRIETTIAKLWEVSRMTTAIMKQL